MLSVVTVLYRSTTEHRPSCKDIVYPTFGYGVVVHAFERTNQNGLERNKLNHTFMTTSNIILGTHSLVRTFARVFRQPHNNASRRQV